MCKNNTMGCASCGCPSCQQKQEASQSETDAGVARLVAESSSPSAFMPSGYSKKSTDEPSRFFSNDVAVEETEPFQSSGYSKKSTLAPPTHIIDDRIHEPMVEVIPSKPEKENDYTGLIVSGLALGAALIGAYVHTGKKNNKVSSSVTYVTSR